MSYLEPRFKSGDYVILDGVPSHDPEWDVGRALHEIDSPCWGRQLYVHWLRSGSKDYIEPDYLVHALSIGPCTTHDILYEGKIVGRVRVADPFELIIGGDVIACPDIPTAIRIACSDRLGATDYLASRAPGRAIIGAMITVGDKGTATVGERGTATAGIHGTAIAGGYGISSAGCQGTAIAGIHGTAIAGSDGEAIAGDYGKAIAGAYGKAIVGYRGTATVGIYGIAVGDRGSAVMDIGGIASAGEGGQIQIKWYDGNRDRLAIGYVGEDGIEPNTPYRCDVNGNFVKVENNEL